VRGEIYTEEKKETTSLWRSWEKPEGLDFILANKERKVQEKAKSQKGKVLLFSTRRKEGNPSEASPEKRKGEREGRKFCLWIRNQGYEKSTIPFTKGASSTTINVLRSKATPGAKAILHDAKERTFWINQMEYCPRTRRALFSFPKRSRLAAEGREKKSLRRHQRRPSRKKLPRPKKDFLAAGGKKG